MEPSENYGIAAFRSRQQVIKFDETLKRRGIRSAIMSTPKEVAIGCGLSVQFPLNDMDKAISLYRTTRPSALIGFYQVQRKNYRTTLIKVPV